MNSIKNQIENIIDSLGHNEKLETILLKTKILLFRFGETEALNWIDKELNGYSKQDELPKYRIVKSKTLTTIKNYNVIQRNIPAPIINLTKEIQKSLTSSKIYESISVIELIANSTENLLTSNLPIEFHQLFQNELPKNIYIHEAYRVIQKSHIVEIISIIRLRLLDFMLKIEDKFPDNASLEEAKTIASKTEIGKTFGFIMNININGDNATITNGNSNHIEQHNSVQKNDIKSLLEYLKTQGIAQPDLDELKQAIKEDSESPQPKGKFGQYVGKWIGKMTSKAAAGLWDITITSGVNLLEKSIGNYYDAE
jgi:hypothetical protein